MADMTPTQAPVALISSDPQVLKGQAHLTGTRLGVDFVRGLMATGWTHGDLLVTYPYITEADIQAIIEYKG